MEVKKTDSYYLVQVYGNYGVDTLGPYPDLDTTLNMINSYCNPDNADNIKIRHIIDMSLGKI